MKTLFGVIKGRVPEPGAVCEPTNGRQAQEASVIKTMLPGQAGTKRWADQFGSALLCVRYREHLALGRRFTTVELVVDERVMTALANSHQQVKPATDPRVAVRINRHELDLRHAVKQAGGRWDPDAGLWFMANCEMRRLGLEARVVHRKAG